MSRKPRMKDPSGIGEKLRALIKANGYTITKAADAIGLGAPTIYETLIEVTGLSPTMAARLHRIGIDGRALYLEQASNKLARYETKEAQIQAKEAQIQDATERLCRTG